MKPLAPVRRDDGAFEAQFEVDRNVAFLTVLDRTAYASIPVTFDSLKQARVFLTKALRQLERQEKRNLRRARR